MSESKFSEMRADRKGFAKAARGGTTLMTDIVDPIVTTRKT